MTGSWDAEEGVKRDYENVAVDGHDLGVRAEQYAEADPSLEVLQAGAKGNGCLGFPFIQRCLPALLTESGGIHNMVTTM